MPKFRIRYNKTAGQPGRGTVDHKWRVFDETGKEWLCKNVRIQTVAWTAIDDNGVDWNFEVEGTMIKEKSTSTIVIV
jgi:hypothetical protein